MYKNLRLTSHSIGRNINISTNTKDKAECTLLSMLLNSIVEALARAIRQGKGNKSIQIGRKEIEVVPQ